MIAWFARLALASFALTALSCDESGPPSTRTSSTQLGSLAERVAFLERYVSFRRAYRDLYFHVVFRNNGGGLLAGPSDWDITVAAQVPPAQLDEWTRGLTPRAAAPGPSAPRSSIDLSGLQEWYGEPSRYVGIDRARSIVLYRNWAH